MKNDVIPQNEEIKFSANEIIVSKTDLKGKLTYVNDVFCRVAEMQAKEVIGKPHNIIRHPDMPRTVFKLLWDTLQNGNELFAYVKNMSATGKYYWVLAHVTPSKDSSGNIIGYHSNRRVPNLDYLPKIQELYQKLVEVEKNATNPKLALEAGLNFLTDKVKEESENYDQYIWKMVA